MTEIILSNDIINKPFLFTSVRFPMEFVITLNSNNETGGLFGSLFILFV